MKVFLVNVMELEKKLITVPHLKALFVVKSPCNTKRIALLLRTSTHR